MHYFLRNCRLNEKIHHFSIRLHVLSRTTLALLPSFTFMAFYSRRLCQNTSVELLQSICGIQYLKTKFSKYHN